MTPKIEPAVVHTQEGRTTQIADSVAHGRRWDNCRSNRLCGKLIYARPIIAENEYTGSLRCSTISSAVKCQRADDVIARRDSFEGCNQNLSIFGKSEAPDVFHHKKAWANLGHQTEKMTEQPATWVVHIGAADLAETLAWRPTDHAIDRACHFFHDICTRQFRHISQMKAPRAKIGLVRIRQNWIYIDGQGHLKARLGSSQAQSAAPTKDIDNFHLLQNSPVLHIGMVC